MPKKHDAKKVKEITLLAETTISTKAPRFLENNNRSSFLWAQSLFFIVKTSKKKHDR